MFSGRHFSTGKLTEFLKICLYSHDFPTVVFHSLCYIIHPLDYCGTNYRMPVRIRFIWCTINQIKTEKYYIYYTL